MFSVIFRDSGFSGIVESMSSVTESSFKECKIKEAIKNITLVDNFENELRGKNQIFCLTFIKLCQYILYIIHIYGI